MKLIRIPERCTDAVVIGYLEDVPVGPYEAIEEAVVRHYSWDYVVTVRMGHESQRIWVRLIKRDPLLECPGCEPGPYGSKCGFHEVPV